MTKININGAEENIDSALMQAVESIGDKKNGLLHYFGRVLHYADEPKFYSYSAKLVDKASASKVGHGFANGFSFFSRKAAVLKCLVEALERYALNTYDPKQIMFAPITKIKELYLDPNSVVGFSDDQRRMDPDLRIIPDCEYAWVKGYQLGSMKKAFIPAQLVYLSYRRKATEQLLRLPISTGAAAGSAYSAAIYRGLCEVIERDAFMITYLNSLSRAKIPLIKSKNKEIQKIVQIAANYNLEIHCFDISTDLDIYTIFTVIVDRTGIASAISTGLKTSLDPIQAVLGSLQESFHPRAFIRRNKDNCVGTEDMMKPTELVTRGVLWSSLESLEHLNFLLNSTNKTKNIDDYEDKSTGTSAGDLQKTVGALTQKGYDSYFVDITPKLKQIKQTSFKVVMTIIPGLQPMHLDENYKYTCGTRLKQIPMYLGFGNESQEPIKLNEFPHPFL